MSDSQNSVGKVVLKLSNEATEVEVLGDWAFVLGTYTAEDILKGGGYATEPKGKWLSVLARKPGGSWKMQRYIWMNLSLANFCETMIASDAAGYIIGKDSNMLIRGFS